MSPIIVSIGHTPDTARLAWADAVAATYQQLATFKSYRAAARHLSTLTGANVEKCRLALRRYTPGTVPTEQHRRAPLCGACKQALAEAIAHFLTTYPERKP